MISTRRYGIGFRLGYTGIAHEADETGTVRKCRFNASILVGPEGNV